jgi:hypothetical protein
VSAESIAWAAGLFEGEGSVVYTPKNMSMGLQMKLTDRDILQRFADAVDSKCRIYGPYAHKDAHSLGSLPVYHWRMTGIFDVQRVLRLFWPYLGERRRAQAALALARYVEDPIQRRCFPRGGQ